MPRTLEQLDIALAQLEAWQDSAREMPVLPSLTPADIHPDAPLLIRAHDGTQSSKLPVGELRDWILQQWGLSPLVLSADTALDAKTHRNRLLLADATGGTLTLTLPPLASVAVGSVFVVQKTDETNHSVTVAEQASDISNVITLTKSQDFCFFIADKAEWLTLTNRRETEDLSALRVDIDLNSAKNAFLSSTSFVLRSGIAYSLQDMRDTDDNSVNVRVKDGTISNDTVFESFTQYSFSNTETYYTVPANAKVLRAKICGGGGGGGEKPGGGGGYAEADIDVTAGETLIFRVGGGGVGASTGGGGGGSTGIFRGTCNQENALLVAGGGGGGFFGGGSGSGSSNKNANGGGGGGSGFAANTVRNAILRCGAGAMSAAGEFDGAGNGGNSRQDGRNGAIFVAIGNTNADITWITQEVVTDQDVSAHRVQFVLESSDAVLNQSLRVFATSDGTHWNELNCASVAKTHDMKEIIVATRNGVKPGRHVSLRIETNSNVSVTISDVVHRFEADEIL